MADFEDEIITPNGAIMSSKEKELLLAEHEQFIQSTGKKMPLAQFAALHFFAPCPSNCAPDASEPDQSRLYPSLATNAMTGPPALAMPELAPVGASSSMPELEPIGVDLLKRVRKVRANRAEKKSRKNRDKAELAEWKAGKKRERADRKAAKADKRRAASDSDKSTSGSDSESKSDSDSDTDSGDSGADSFAGEIGVGLTGVKKRVRKVRANRAEKRYRKNRDKAELAEWKAGKKREKADRKAAKADKRRKAASDTEAYFGMPTLLPIRNDAALANPYSDMPELISMNASALALANPYSDMPALAPLPSDMPSLELIGAYTAVSDLPRLVPLAARSSNNIGNMSVSAAANGQSIQRILSEARSTGSIALKFSEPVVPSRALVSSSSSSACGGQLSAVDRAALAHSVTTLRNGFVKDKENFAKQVASSKSSLIAFAAELHAATALAQRQVGASSIRTAQFNHLDAKAIERATAAAAADQRDEMQHSALLSAATTLTKIAHANDYNSSVQQIVGMAANAQDTGGLSNRFFEHAEEKWGALVDKIISTAGRNWNYPDQLYLITQTNLRSIFLRLARIEGKLDTEKHGSRLMVWSAMGDGMTEVAIQWMKKNMSDKVSLPWVEYLYKAINQQIGNVPVIKTDKKRMYLKDSPFGKVEKALRTISHDALTNKDRDQRPDIAKRAVSKFVESFVSKLGKSDTQTIMTRDFRMVYVTASAGLMLIRVVLHHLGYKNTPHVKALRGKVQQALMKHLDAIRLYHLITPFAPNE